MIYIMSLRNLTRRELKKAISKSSLQPYKKKKEINKRLIK